MDHGGGPFCSFSVGQTGRSAGGVKTPHPGLFRTRPNRGDGVRKDFSNGEEAPHLLPFHERTKRFISGQLGRLGHCLRVLRRRLRRPSQWELPGAVVDFAGTSSTEEG